MLRIYRVFHEKFFLTSDGYSFAQPLRSYLVNRFVFSVCPVCPHSPFVALAALQSWSWTHLQVLLESLFPLRELFNTAARHCHRSVWDRESLNADRSSKRIKQLFIRPRKTKNATIAAGWKLKFAFYFMETIHEALHWDKWSFVQWKITDICKFNLNHHFLWQSFWIWRRFEILRFCWDRFWEFCDIVRCYTIVNYRVGHEKVARLPFARVLVIFSLWHLWYSLWR
jgi:hypothetical protein